MRLPTGKPGDKGGKALTSLAGQLSADTVMLLTTPRLDGSTTRTKWYKALDGAGVVVQIWPLERKDFPGWLNSRLRASGLQADQDAVELLAERLEGNLLAAVQEIERLRLEFMGRQQPAAGPLRVVYATIKINQELERIGDYAESVARQGLLINSLDVDIDYSKFKNSKLGAEGWEPCHFPPVSGGSLCGLL